MTDARASSPERLPRLILIADRYTDPDVAARTLEAVRAGIQWIQLRDHEASDSACLDAVTRLLGAAGRPERPLRASVNSRMAIADTLGTAFHTGAHGPSVREAVRRFGGSVPVGASVHSLEEARSARDEGADYVTYSPVYPTESKPGHPGAGTDALASVVDDLASVPVYALGGVSPDRVRDCLRAGAYGVAVQRGILEADDIGRAVRLYSDSIR